ncbi:MAG: DUF3866 family protein [Microthrixaceae bacterium]|nr:DUF3866 family protein [Microthrixaceae bacterium]
MSDHSDAKAYALTELIGECEAGDDVIVNTTAVDRALGTGGWHFVHWNLKRSELIAPGPDHIMKIRYTSLQADVGTEELVDPRCDDPITGIPVVVCSVHSQVAAVAAAFAKSVPRRKLVYVMTDGASLPMAMSDLVETMKERELISSTITAGHAFGGDVEAVTVPSALGLAVHALSADVVVVGMGPGVVGTGTDLGNTAIEVAPILDAVAAAGGVPIMCVRASSGDPRDRHWGVSHHSVTAARLAHCNPIVASVPPEVADLSGVRVMEWPAPDPVPILDQAGLGHVTTMGRSVERDELFFAAACAAGQLAAHVVEHGADVTLDQLKPPTTEQSNIAISRPDHDGVS